MTESSASLKYPMASVFATGLMLGLGGCRGGEPDEQPSPTQAVVPTQGVSTASPVPMPGERQASVLQAQQPSAAPPPARLTLPVGTVVMDVLQVVGKTEAEVASVLGEPVACADIHRARLCRYGAHEDEVMFVRDKADMITVQGMDGVAFGAAALGALGLPATAPSHADEHAIRWDSLPGLVEVAVFPGPGDAVGYAYVKVGKH